MELSLKNCAICAKRVVIPCTLVKNKVVYYDTTTSKAYVYAIPSGSENNNHIWCYLIDVTSLRGKSIFIKTADAYVENQQRVLLLSSLTGFTFDTLDRVSGNPIEQTGLVETLNILSESGEGQALINIPSTATYLMFNYSDNFDLESPSFKIDCSEKKNFVSFYTINTHVTNLYGVPSNNPAYNTVSTYLLRTTDLANNQTFKVKTADEYNAAQKRVLFLSELPFNLTFDKFSDAYLSEGFHTYDNPYILGADDIVTEPGIGEKTLTLPTGTKYILFNFNNTFSLSAPEVSVVDIP